MKILVISSLFYPRIDGSVRVVHDWSFKLAERGHTVLLLTRRLHGTNRRENVDGIDVIRLGLPGGSLLERSLLSIAEGVEAARTVRRERVDVIHAHGVVPGIAGVMGRLLGRAPVVVTFHGHQLVWPEFVRWRGEVTVRSSLVLEREVLRSVQVVNAQSDSIGKFFTKLYGPEVGRKVRVVPNGVDLTKFRPPALTEATCSTSKSTVLFVGTLTRRKGVDILVRAAPEILNRKPGATFQIVGRGPQLANLIALAEGLRVRGSFTFDTEAPDKRLSEYYSNASVVVLPTYAEFFPLVPLEAMAMSKPVVSTRVMGPTDIIQDGKNGILVEPGKPERLAEAIIHILENDQLAREMGCAGRELVERKYDLNIVVDQLEKMYEQTANNFKSQ